ncbi:MAG: hypothetical protein R6X02_08535 [Enhygromyxa sp.]
MSSQTSHDVELNELIEPFELTVSADNLDKLEQLVTLAAERGARRCTLVSTQVSLEQSIPAVRAALARCRALGIEGRVRQLPRCLLEGDAEALIDERASGTEDRRASCLFEAHCGQSEACPGLAHAYIARHGWEERRLRPSPRERPWRAPPPSCHGHAAWLALLGCCREQVERVELDRLALRYFMRMPGGVGLAIELRSRDEQKPAFARSRSFDITYTRVEAPVDPQALARFVEPIAAAIIANDDGNLSLDPRRDLPALPALV